MSDWKSRAKPVEAPAESGWRARAKPVAEEGTPLADALASQTGDVVTVETPTGPAKFTRGGQRFYTPEESRQMADAGGARFKESTLETALSFLSGGGPLVDELAGAKRALSVDALGKNALDEYRQGRDEVRRAVGRADRNGPQTPSFEVSGRTIPSLPAAKLAGAVAPSLFAPNPSGVVARILSGGAVGAEQALGESNADLTRGDLPGLLRDTGKGAAFGLASTGAVEGVTAPIRAIARGAASRIGDVVAGKATSDAADIADEIASVKGKLGSESQKLSRYFENTQRAAGGGVAPAGASPISPAVQAKAILALTDPAAAAAQEKIIERSAGAMGPQAATVNRLEQELAAKTAGASAEASKRTADFFAKPTITTDVLPRVGRQLQNAAIGTVAAIPVAAGFGAHGGKLGAMAALAAGASTGLSKGALNSARTTLANPRLQVGALESLIQASQAGQKALQKGARSAAAVEPVEDEEAVNAFLSGG